MNVLPYVNCLSTWFSSEVFGEGNYATLHGNNFRQAIRNGDGRREDRIADKSPISRGFPDASIDLRFFANDQNKFI
jgi:hypothetical protein